MNILQVTSSYLPVRGGMENVVASVSSELVRRGHEVTVLTTDLYSDTQLVKEEVLDGVRVIRCKNAHFAFGYGFSPEFRRELHGVWSAFQVAHVHGYNRFASEYALYYLRNRLPTVFTAHGFIHTGSAHPLKQLHERTLGKVVRFADACTALSPEDRSYFIKQGVTPEKIFDVPNGVDIKRFTSPAKPAEISALRHKWGVKPAERVVLFVGRVHQSKGLSFLVQAMTRLPRVRLVIVGKDAGYASTVARLAKEYGVFQRLVLAGSVSEDMLPAVFQSADVFAMPSEMEGFGLAIVEAMASGLPVVASDRGAIPSLVRNGSTGFVVPYGEVHALVEKIEYILSHPSVAKKYGDAGRLRALQDYSWDHVVDLLELIYRRVAIRSKGRGKK